jgi:hypothetical protein
MQQRDAIKLISPPWLSSDDGERFMYNIGLASDLILEKLNQAIRIRLPGLGDSSQLLPLGNDRVLSQGPTETNVDFATRLSRSFETWQIAGNRRSVMAQALIYLAGYHTSVATQVPRAMIVSLASDGVTLPFYSTWFTYYNTSDLTAPCARVRTSTTFRLWLWDDKPERHGRCGLVLYFGATDTLAAGPVWGYPGYVWGDTTISWGLNIAPSVIVGLRILLKRWKSAGSYYPNIIVCFAGGDSGTGTELSPNSTLFTGNPNQDWGRHGKIVAGVYSAARSTNCRFVQGSAEYNQCFESTE